MRGLAGNLVVIGLGLVLMAGSVAAEETPADSTTSIPSGIPEMHGHRFVPAPLVPTPFIHTFLRNTLGMASAKNVETPPIYIGGQPVPGLRGDLSAVVLAFEYQLALKRWLALRGQVGLSGRFGTGVQTLLAEGVTTDFSFDFGWLFNLRRGERTALSGALSVTNRTVTTVSVYNLVSDLVEGTDYGLSHKTPVLKGEGELSFAWALSKLVGLTASAAVGNGDTLDRFRGTSWHFRTGLAFSFDLDEYGVPMGVVISGAVDDIEGSETGDGATASEAGLRLSYIGREAFLISLDLSRANMPTTGRVESFKSTWVGLSLRYYF